MSIAQFHKLIWPHVTILFYSTAVYPWRAERQKESRERETCTMVGLICSGRVLSASASRSDVVLSLPFFKPKWWCGCVVESPCRPVAGALISIASLEPRKEHTKQCFVLIRLSQNHWCMSITLLYCAIIGIPYQHHLSRSTYMKKGGPAPCL